MPAMVSRPVDCCKRCMKKGDTSDSSPIHVRQVHSITAHCTADERNKGQPSLVSSASCCQFYMQQEPLLPPQSSDVHYAVTTTTYIVIVLPIAERQQRRLDDVHLLGDRPVPVEDEMHVNGLEHHATSPVQNWPHPLRHPWRPVPFHHLPPFGLSLHFTLIPCHSVSWRALKLAFFRCFSPLCLPLLRLHLCRPAFVQLIGDRPSLGRRYHPLETVTRPSFLLVVVAARTSSNRCERNTCRLAYLSVRMGCTVS